MKATFPELQVIQTTLASIRGVDPQIQKFLGGLGYVPDVEVDLASWSPDAARLIYLRLPMLVVARKSGFDVIGDGRTLLLAQRSFSIDEPIPVLCTKNGRLALETKLSFLAAEVYGLTPMYRTRRHLPRSSMAIWSALTELGILTILGDGARAFSRGTGYSLAALTTPSSDLEPDADAVGQFKSP